MQHTLATREELRRIIDELQKKHQNLLYRGLSFTAEQEYKTTKQLLPKSGDYSVGTGIFFTNNLDYALNFAQHTIIITTQELLDPEQQTIDERITGYYAQTEQELERKLGKGNYNCWMIEQEVQKNDTITHGPNGTHIYTKRAPVKKQELLLEITINETTEANYGRENKAA